MSPQNSPRVLVSGASGLIGSALVSALQAQGAQVVQLTRGAVKRADQISWGLGTPLAPQSVSGFDAVVHLAGESIVGRWSDAKKQAIRDSRVRGTQNLANALAKAEVRPRVFLSGSAIGFYGDRGNEVLREDSTSGQNFLAGVCREWEAAAQPAIAAGIRTAFLRTGVVLSAAGGALAKMLPPFKMGVGGKVGSGQQWMSWISLEDEVGAILHVLKSDRLCGAVNLVSPETATNADFTKVLASVLSRPAIFPVPAFAARLAFGEMADELLLASQRVEPAKLMESGYRFRHSGLRLALEAILKG